MLSFRMHVLRFAFGAALAGLLPATVLLAADPQTISSVEVQEEGEVTRIVLRGATDPIYTAFMRENPPRLIVELPDVTFEGIGTPIAVANGRVNEVALGAFGDPRVALTMGRISIGLDQVSEYELIPGGDSLAIEIRPLASGPEPGPVVAATTSSETPNAMPAAPDVDPAHAGEMAPAAEADVVPAPESSVTTAVEPAEAVEPTDDAQVPAAPGPETWGVATTPSEPATPKAADAVRITKLEADGAGAIRVFASGPVDNVDAFSLSDPERLVVDFWGVTSKAWPAKFDVEQSIVRRVRVGQHADKVRVVLDLDGPADHHEVSPLADGVRIVVQGDLAAASDSTEAPTPRIPAAHESAVEPRDEPAAWAEDSAQPEPADDWSNVPASSEPETSEPGSAEPAHGLPTPEQTATRETATTQTAQPGSGADPAMAWVESVHFESLPEADRIVVQLDRQVESSVVEPDPQTVIVTLPWTNVAADSERRVDTKEFRGAVDFFSVFTTPDVERQEVRVVLKRNTPVAPNLRWEGTTLMVEMPKLAASLQELHGGAVPASSAPAHGMERLAPAPAAIDPDDFDFGGPADPAAIDILEPGGFNEEKAYSGRRISLDFKDADIGNILRLIAEVSDLNVIAGEEVAGEVTIRLVDVPWDQALDVILLTKGLGFVRVGNVLRIAPLETLKIEAEARLRERRSKEVLEDLVVKLQPVNYADSKEVSDLVSRLLSPRGSVNVDKRTNTLIIKDIPSVIHEATALVKAVDTQTPQVLVEAKIVEASLAFSRSLGTVWGAGYRPVASTSTTPGGSEDFHLGNAAPSLLGATSQGTNFLASNPAGGALNGLLNLGILSLDDHLQLDLQLQAAEANNKGKVISSPRVVTLDNREAVIKQGVAVKFEASTQDKITVSFIDAVLELKVTPHITANRSIIMNIKVSRNAPQLSQAGDEIVGIAKNETATEALVRDGETMVLGGIYVVDSGRNDTKVPFMADLPVLGSMFKSNTVLDERRELLIFVTPRVILGAPSDV